MTDVCRAVLLPTKPLSDDDFGFRHGFGAVVSLLLTQGAQQYLLIQPGFVWHHSLEISYLCCCSQSLIWELYIYIYIYIYILLSDRESPSLVKNVEVGLVMKP